MSTTNYSFNLPTVGGSEDAWGTQLNANWTALDTRLFSGSIGANTTGNAATATLATTATTATSAVALQTARNINGVSFNGTADITLPTVNTSGNQSVSGVKTFTDNMSVNGTLTATSFAGNGAALTNLPTPTSAQVGAATAGLNTGDVGSYAFLANVFGTSSNPGDTQAASNLQYFGIRDTQIANFGNIYGAAPSAGTWRCMGIANASGGVATAGTLWLRIA